METRDTLTHSTRLERQILDSQGHSVLIDDIIEAVAQGYGEYQRMVASFEGKDDITLTEEFEAIFNATGMVMKDFLSKKYSDVPILWENDNIVTRTFSSEICILLAPVEGRSDFINHAKGGITCAAAIALRGSPCFGAISYPALDDIHIYCGDVVHDEVYVVDKNSRNTAEYPFFDPCSDKDLRIGVLDSASVESDVFLSHFPGSALQNLPSSINARLLCAARGQVDIYPQFSATKEWETCAGHAILLAAGGELIQLQSGDGVIGTLGYCKPNALNASFVSFARKRAIIKSSNPLDSKDTKVSLISDDDDDEDEEKSSGLSAAILISSIGIMICSIVIAIFHKELGKFMEKSWNSLK